MQAYHCRFNKKLGVPACASLNGSSLLTAEMPWWKCKIWADNADKNARRHLHQDRASSIRLPPHFAVALDYNVPSGLSLPKSAILYHCSNLISPICDLWNMWRLDAVAVVWGHRCMLTTAKQTPWSLIQNTPCMVLHYKQGQRGEEVAACKNMKLCVGVSVVTGAREGSLRKEERATNRL